MCSCSQLSITCSFITPSSQRRSISLSARSAKNLAKTRFSSAKSSSPFNRAIELSISICAALKGCLTVVSICLYICYTCSPAKLQKKQDFPKHFQENLAFLSYCGQRAVKGRLGLSSSGYHSSPQSKKAPLAPFMSSSFDEPPPNPGPVVLSISVVVPWVSAPDNSVSNESSSNSSKVTSGVTYIFFLIIIGYASSLFTLY